MKRFSIAAEEKERLYHTELIKVGIDFDRAEKVAKLLSRSSLDEHLSPEEEQLIQEVCAQWLVQKKRLALISQILNKVQKESVKYSGDAHVKAKNKLDDLPVKSPLPR